MAKGIIVLDKIPKTCQHIRGNKEDGCPFGGMVCQICDKDVMKHTVHGTKPDWCTIKEIPVRLEELKCPHSMSDYQRKGFSRGWNACLDEIERSAENEENTERTVSRTVQAYKRKPGTSNSSNGR